MKKLLTIVGIVATAGAMLAQGQVNFLNYSTANGVNGRVKDPAGNYIGVGYWGQLFAAATQTGPYASVGVPVEFRSSTATPPVGLGIVTGGAVTIPASIIPTSGGPVWLQLRAWQGAAGSDYSSALTKGISAPINLAATGNGGTIPPVYLAGLAEFSLVPIPEPSTYALLALGLAGLMIRRRK